LSQFGADLVRVFDKPRENDFTGFLGSKSEISRETVGTEPNQPKTANFKRFLTHFGHFGAFLLDFWPFFRFFDPLFRKIHAGRELSHVAAIIPNPGKTELAPPVSEPPPRPLRQTVFPVQSFRAFRNFRSFSPPPLRLRVLA
jgi:hypothetical protein